MGSWQSSAPLEWKAVLPATMSGCPALPAYVQNLVRKDVGKRCPRSRGANQPTFTMGDVAEHHFVNDSWIVIDGQVYDITDHLLHHPGWQPTGDTTTPLSILAHAGTDCSKEFHEIHRVYPIAYKQLPAFHIGQLSDKSSAAKTHTLQHSDSDTSSSDTIRL